MADIRCAQCGEPWDSSLEDMEPGERTRFKKGEGCPCCRFGTICPSCNGTGFDENYIYLPQELKDCLCHGRGYVYAFSPKTNQGPYEAGEFYVGYEPNVTHVDGPMLKHLDPIVMGVRTFPEKVGEVEYKTGWIESWVITCPWDHVPTNKCAICEGSGKLVNDDPERRAVNAMRDAVDATDEDPIAVIIERGML